MSISAAIQYLDTRSAETAAPETGSGGSSSLRKGLNMGGGDKASMIALAWEVINRGGALDPVWDATPEEEPRRSCESLAVSCTNRK